MARTDVEAGEAKWQEAFNGGDASGVAARYETDARLMAPNLPTMEGRSQIEAFVKDKSPDAYQKVVDRLLASQAYAEHQAVPWLDAVRYADPAGYHSDGERPAWPYLRNRSL